MATDATKRPLRIPVSYQNYAEEQGVYDLIGEMLQSLLISQPADPLTHMLHYLEGDGLRRVNVAVLGPPGSGKSSVAANLAKETDSTLVSDYEKVGELSEKRNGWVLDGFPRNRAEALRLQERGLLIDYVFVLYGPKELMKERQNGKKVDPETGIVYHPVFNWTADTEIVGRLKDVEISDFDTNYDEYQKNREIVIDAHGKTVHRINADQPLDDVKQRVLGIVAQQPPSEARFVVKSVLLGPTGAGKRTIAEKLARQWNIVPIDLNNLIEREILNHTRIGAQLEGNRENISTHLLGRILKSRIEMEDCVKRGWVLFACPSSGIEAAMTGLINERIIPNRVIVLQLSRDSIIERLSNRLNDPKTGKTYHALYDPATDDTILRRLVKRQSDCVEQIEMRLDSYNAQLSPTLDSVSDLEPIMVNADQDPDIVYQLVESKLSKPKSTVFD